MIQNGVVKVNKPELWRHALKPPREDGHKYDRGHLAIWGGGIAHTGAARLAARAALRSGCGLVSLLCDDAALPVYAASLEAVMTQPMADPAAIPEFFTARRVVACVLGPGNGITTRTRAAVMACLSARIPVVLDADALSVFEHDPDTLFAALHGQCILTPHEGEFSRLFTHKAIEMKAAREDRAFQAARLSGAVVVLKGAHSVIAAPDGGICVNRHASPYLATAGSGDVLAGICGALLAQGVDSYPAACAAVWLHGDAARRFGPGLIAEDLPDLLPHSWRALRSMEHENHEK